MSIDACEQHVRMYEEVNMEDEQRRNIDRSVVTQAAWAEGRRDYMLQLQKQGKVEVSHKLTYGIFSSDQPNALVAYTHFSKCSDTDCSQTAPVDSPEGTQTRISSSCNSSHPGRRKARNQCVTQTSVPKRYVSDVTAAKAR